MEYSYHTVNKCKLIINYLPQMLTDSEFKKLFEDIGPLKESKIVRQKTTGYSYGFGFIEYKQEVDATRAIATLNGSSLHNKKIKVSYARPGGDTIKNANIYIRGIPKTMSLGHLRYKFSEFGDIIQCKFPKKADPRFRVAFILYDKHEQAEEAIKKMNGKKLDGSNEPLFITYAEPTSKKLKLRRLDLAKTVTGDKIPVTHMVGLSASSGPLHQSTQGHYRFNPLGTGIGRPGAAYSYGAPSSLSVDGQGHILFVYNIGSDTDEKTLGQMFSRYGAVQKVDVIRDSATRCGKGYGFVTMANYNEAEMAIESLNGSDFFGKPLQVSFKKPRQASVAT